MSPTLLHVEPVRRYLGARLLCSVPSQRRALALTFDDGPNARNTPRLLDLLAAHGVHATFFVVGARAARFPQLVRRAHEEGHEIANHGYRHWPLPLLPAPLLRRELRATNELVESITGRPPRFLRPPMGWFTRRCLRLVQEEGLEPVIGDIHPEDSRRPPVETILARVRPRVADGSIVILHDGGWRVGADRTPTLEAVDRLVKEWKGEGRRLLTVSELVGPAG